MVFGKEFKFKLEEEGEEEMMMRRRRVRGDVCCGSRGGGAGEEGDVTAVTAGGEAGANENTAAIRELCGSSLDMHPAHPPRTRMLAPLPAPRSAAPPASPL